MPKSTKTFVLSTSQLNSHGFRTMTDGADLSEFKANPLMYWLHMEPSGKSKDEPLPIGFWEDIKIFGDEITAVPNFDDNDPFAMQIYNKVEHGTIRAASIEVEPIKLDANKKNWVAGQKLPTVLQWKTGEASIVDRGSNKGAIAKLKHAGQAIALSDQASADDFFTSLQKTDEDKMKLKLNAKTSKALKLAEDTELDATDVVDKLVDLVEEKEKKVTELDAEVVKLKGAEKTGRVKLMLKTAVDEGKIVAGDVAELEKLASTSDESEASVKAYLGGKKTTQKLRDVITDKAEEGNDEVAELMKQSWDDLFKGDGITKLKKLSQESYKLKFKQKFGRLPA